MKRVLLLFLAAPLAAWGAAGGYRLDRAPIDPNDLASLQAGAQLFVNYCMNCHGLQYMRYNRLTDLGLTEAQIRDHLIFTGDKVGDTMRVAMTPKDGKAWFGVAPPDLSLVGRSRGADWLYTYLRTFYRDPKTPSGWNNAVFPNVAMPHALWPLEGERVLEIVPTRNRAGHVVLEYRWTRLAPGQLPDARYDAAVRDLVNFLMYVAEPQARARKTIGIVALFVLSVLLVLAWALKKEYWKDVT